MLDWMRSDPLGFFTFMLYRAPAVLIALTLHEISHGYIAYLCGDDTAKRMGRLSLNPFRHLSLIGTLLMFTVGMGWAKPVPVNPNNYRHGRRDDFLVSIAGVTMNFLLFTFATVLMVFVNERLWDPRVFSMGAQLATRTDFLSFSGVNFTQIMQNSKYIWVEATGNGYYNVLDAAKYMQTPWLIHVQRFLYQFSFCNLGMCVFNLLPFPPLDGFHVFNDILLRGKLQLNAQAFRVSMLAMLVLMNVTDVFSRLISAVTHFIQGGEVQFFLTLFGLS
ncbi:MAG: site-2 protease family protein [Clostridia bacterium]|nr:site-2 protease family protein [Clostridia bacterium]